ncbi:hypothetical protein [Lentzea californiensis]|uniref:hypothetical protein n=1 Tax=Lentzea californiensis TaxID=438851 RepID=UPI0021641C95|nr:hypothetical protein [Lentzea californiensis]
MTQLRRPLSCCGVGWLGLGLVEHFRGFVQCLIGGKAAQPSRQSSAVRRRLR